MLNGGMTPWDYYSQGTQIAQRNQGLQNQQQEMQARMQQMRNQQVIQQMQQERLNQLLPMQVGLGQARAAALDPNSPNNLAKRKMTEALTGRASSQADLAKARTAQVSSGGGAISPNSPQAIQNRADLAQFTSALGEHKLQTGMLNKNISGFQKDLTGAGAGSLLDAPNIWPVDATGKAVDENDPAAVGIGYGVDSQGGLANQVKPTMSIPTTMATYRQLQGAKQKLQGMTPPVWKGSANSDGARAQAAIDRINSSGIPDDAKTAAIAKIHAQLQGAVAPSSAQTPPAGMPGDAGPIGEDSEPGEDDTEDTEEPDEPQ